LCPRLLHLAKAKTEKLETYGYKHNLLTSIGIGDTPHECCISAKYFDKPNQETSQLVEYIFDKPILISYMLAFLAHHLQRYD